MYRYPTVPHGGTCPPVGLSSGAVAEGWQRAGTKDNVKVNEIRA